ncbi:MAG: hypothetical protein EBQ75_00195 [Actinobacteria bacterium]|nr:hypothetical protein [Actinomycetota bacterium]
MIEAGDPLVWFDVRSHHLVVFDAALERLGWIEALESATKDGRMSRLEVRKVNGSSINDEDVVVDAVRGARAGRLHARLSRLRQTRLKPVTFRVRDLLSRLL